MAIDNDALLAAIDAGRENSYGTDEQSRLGRLRQKAMEYYLGLNTNPAPEGRSQIVDRSVYETIQTQLPALVKIYAGSSDEVVKATPIGPDDEQAADQHTAILNYIVTQQNAWEQICQDWIHDTLLMANGYAMAYWDETENIVRETYEGQSEDQVAMLAEDKDITILEHSQEVDEEATEEALEQWQQMVQQVQMQYQQAAQQAQMQGQPPPQPPELPPQPGQVFKHDLVIERREHEGKVCIKVLAPEHCYVSADSPDWTLKECPYFEFRQEKTIGDLRAMGLDVDDNISDNEDDDSVEDNARDRLDEDRELDGGLGAMRRVWARMIWVRGDCEGDDKTRLYYVIAVGRTVLFAQQCSRIPVSSMVTQPMPHRHIGMSEAETVFDTQDTKTAVKRGGLDNLYLMNAGRHAISSKVNLEDFLDARPGGVVRMLDDSMPAEGHIMPLVHPVAFDQIIGSLEYFDQERQNRTGAMRGAAGLEANAMNRAAVGTTVAMQSHASMRMEHKARTMAPAVEELFSCVQEIMQKHANKAITIKLKGKWVTVDPQAWRTKRDLRISVGVGAGNKEAMLAQLQMLLGAQMQLMQIGVAGPQQIHATMYELIKQNGFANPDRFLIDPTKQPPPPPQPSPDQIKAQTQVQIKQMELQADAQKFQAEKQFRMQEIQATTQAKLQEVRATLELQYANDARDAQREQINNAAAHELEQKRLALEAHKTELQAQLAKYQTDQDNAVKLQVAGVQQQTALVGKEIDAAVSIDQQATQIEADAGSEAFQADREDMRYEAEEEAEQESKPSPEVAEIKKTLSDVSKALSQVLKAQSDLADQHKEFVAESKKPKKVERDKDGKITKIGGRSVVRDADGKATGVS
jgi:hypothetical protein